MRRTPRLPPLWGLACILLLAACVTGPVVEPAPVAPPQARESCEAFCELRVALQCEDTGDSPGPDEIDGTADDVPCAEVCRDVVTQGEFAPDRACLETADSCAKAEACIFGEDVCGIPPRPSEDALYGPPRPRGQTPKRPPAAPRRGSWKGRVGLMMPDLDEYVAVARGQAQRAWIDSTLPPDPGDLMLWQFGTGMRVLS